MDALSSLAQKHRTDKGLHHHGYTPIYDSYFQSLKDKDIRLLEIGVGGYQYPDKGGESLRMWAEYFPAATIVAIDIYPKTLLLPPNTTVLCGSQVDSMFLDGLPHPFDIIIDDGSHVCEHIISTFKSLFPKLNSGGIYVVEDTETSYWDEEYGGSTSPFSPTTMNYFKFLCDTLNPEFGVPDTFNIKSIHFYKGLIFIFKQ